MEIFLGKKGQQTGPYSVEEVRALVGKGEFGPNHLCWHKGLSGWKRISEVAEIGIGAGYAVPPLPGSAGMGTSSLPFYRYPEFLGGAPWGYVVFVLATVIGGMEGVYLAIGAAICSVVARWKDSPFLGAVWLLVSSLVAVVGSLLFMASVLFRVAGSSTSLGLSLALQGAWVVLLVGGLVWLTKQPGRPAVLANSVVQVLMVIVTWAFLFNILRTLHAVSDGATVIGGGGRIVGKDGVMTFLHGAIVFHLWRGLARGGSALP